MDVFVSVTLIGMFVGMFFMFKYLDKLTKPPVKPPAQLNEDDPDFLRHVERNMRKHPGS